MQCLFALSEGQRSRRCGEKHMSETVTGYIDHVIFRNEDNGYTVMVLKGTKKEEELTCVGSFPAITQGASIEATGVYIHHPVYGKQFQIRGYIWNRTLSGFGRHQGNRCCTGCQDRAEVWR